MGGIDADANRGLSLQTDEIGINQCPPADFHRPRLGEKGRDKHRRGVADRRVKVVVIVECMRGGAVDHRRDRRGCAAAADHRAFARNRNLRRNGASYGLSRKVIDAGDHAADGIGDRVDRAGMRRADVAGADEPDPDATRGRMPDYVW